MGSIYPDILLSNKQAENIVLDLYGIQGKAIALPGELDINFRIESAKGSFLLKVSRPDTDPDYLEFQQAILQHVVKSDPEINSPIPLQDLQGKYISETSIEAGNIRKVRLLTWIEGRLWSGVNPKGSSLLFSLGKEAGRLSLALKGFEHPLAIRDFEWDVAQARWTGDHEHLFSGEKLLILRYFQEQFEAVQKTYGSLRKSVVHNDVNDNNVVLTEDLENLQSHRSRQVFPRHR